MSSTSLKTSTSSLSNRDIVIQYNTLKQEIQAIAEKLNEMEAECDEHK
jgi:hypothetical protein